MDKKYKYDAFISYRHNDLDKFTAEKLHYLIETYKMPKAVSLKYNINDNNIRRVFRDQEELPLASNLETPIIQALKETKFLIVICSPRLKESIWCKREIENFIKFHGRENILCVLVEGEPSESFPEELLYDEIKENGKVKKVSCEPLAMDVRATTKKEVYKKLKQELIRIIAPMYNLDYDDIKRRHVERELKRKVRLFRTITIASILFALYSCFLFLKIYNSSNKLKYDQAITLAESSHDLLKQDLRDQAILKAYNSITKYKKTNLGVKELTDSLGIYYPPTNIYPIKQYDLDAIVNGIKTDINSKYLLSSDNSNKLILWDVKNNKKLKEIDDPINDLSTYKYSFIASDKYIYQNNNKELIIMNIKGDIVKKIKFDYIVTNITDGDIGKYFVVSSTSKIYVYDTKDYNIITTYNIPNGYKALKEIYFDEKEENVVFGIVEDEMFKENTKVFFKTLNISKKNIINTTEVNTTYITKLVFNNDNLYVLSNRSNNLNYTMILTSYNYLNGKINYQQEYSDKWAKALSRSYSKEINSLLVSSYDTAYMLNMDTGELEARFSIGDEIIKTYAIVDSDLFIVYTGDGNTHIIKGKTKKDVIYLGLYNFNLNNYKDYIIVDNKIITYTNDDNKIIVYGNIENKNIKEIEYKDKEFKYLDSKKKDEFIKDYNFPKKNLINSIVYSKSENLLFVSYTDNKLEVYNNKNKKLLNSINIDFKLDFYLGKTKDNKYVLKGSLGGYILNKDFEIYQYVPSLYDIKDNKLILKEDDKYYETKIYDVKELKELAKERLDNK